MVYLNHAGIGLAGAALRGMAGTGRRDARAPSRSLPGRLASLERLYGLTPPQRAAADRLEAGRGRHRGGRNQGGRPEDDRKQRQGTLVRVRRSALPADRAPAWRRHREPTLLGLR
jgi:hypothetical protein